MSWRLDITPRFRPAAALACALLLLSACGFQPVHGRRAAAPELEQVEVAPIPGRTGQLLRISLEDRLRAGGAAAWRLEASIAVTPQAVGIEADREITRYNLHLVSSFRLLRTGDGKEVLSGTVRRIASYNVSDSDFSTHIASRDALKRGLDELAEDYRMRLAAFFAGVSTLQP